MNISQLRADTPGCKNRIHLNNAGAGLMPKPVIDSIRDYIELEGNIGGYEAKELRNNDLNGFYVACAKLLNCKPRNTAFTSHATESYNKALSAIPFERGDVLLTTDDDYISNQIAFFYLQKRWGVQLIRASKLPEGGVDVDSMRDLIKKHHPKLVAVTHVPTNSGLVQGVESIGEICKAEDIWYLVDACQTVGQMPLDVDKIHCDFLSAATRKFLRGPRGAGFLYVSDKALEANLEPVFPDMEGAFWVEKNNYELHKDAIRFEYWEKAYALMMGSKVSMEYALELGLEAIETRVSLLANYTRAQLLTVPGLRLLDRGRKKCGIVTAAMENVNKASLQKKLMDLNINITLPVRPHCLIDFSEKEVEWGLRISPHYYNTTEEVDELVNALKNS